MNQIVLAAEELTRNLVNDPEFLRAYVYKRFGVYPTIGAKIVAIALVEAQEADIDARRFDSFVRRCWKVDAGGALETETVQFSNEMGGNLYKVPILRFFHNGDRVLVSEWFAPSLLLRRVLPIGDCLRAFDIDAIQESA